MEAVDSASYKRENETMFDIAGGRTTGTDKNIYGLFGDSNGGNMHWTQVASIDEEITSLASTNGNHIIIGTDQGHIMTCDTDTGVVTPRLVSMGLVERLFD